MLELAKRPGSYVVVLRADTAVQVSIGRLGELAVQPGFYLYVGSAFGAGGIASRVQRHLRAHKKQHWHLDYLRPYATPTAVWCTYDPQPREHLWAMMCAQMPQITRPMRGFGSSDCACETHLFFSPHAPDASLFIKPAYKQTAAHQEIEVWQLC